MPTYQMFSPQQQNMNNNQVIGVSLRCSGKKIEMVDGLLGKSDPFLQIFEWDGTQAVGPCIWQTEAIDNTRSPSWKPFPIFYDFFQGNMKTRIVVQIYDYESNGQHQFIGQFVTPVEDFTEGHEFKFENAKKKKKVGYKNSGTLVISGSTVITNASENHGRGYLNAARYQITFEANGLDRKDGLGKSDPYLVIKCSPENPDGSRQDPYVIGRSEIITDKVNVVWNPLYVEGNVCHPLAPLILEVYDFDPDLRNDLIGIATTNLHMLRMGELKLALINPKKKKNLGYRNSGVIHVRDFQLNNEIRPEILSFNVSLSARRLSSRDFLGKSDPYVTISAVPYHYISFPGHPRLNSMVNPQMLPVEERPSPSVIFRSEFIMDNHEPTWKEFELNVADCGGLQGNLLLQVWDHDRKTADKLIGECVTNLIELQTPGIDYRLKSPSKKHHGSQGVLSVNEIIGNNHQAGTGFPLALAYSVTFHGHKISRKDGGITKNARNSDPYLVFQASPYNSTTEGLVEIARTTHIDSSRNPEWTPIILEVAKCGGIDSPIHITCYDKDKNSTDDLVGDTVLSLRQLHQLCSLQMGSPLLAGDKKTRKRRNFGVLDIAAFQPQ